MKLKMKNSKKKKIAEIGWMPFWWGNKFNKKLANKRVRQQLKKEDKECKE